MIRIAYKHDNIIYADFYVLENGGAYLIHNFSFYLKDLDIRSSDSGLLFSLCYLLVIWCYCIL